MDDHEVIAFTQITEQQPELQAAGLAIDIFSFFKERDLDYFHFEKGVVKFSNQSLHTASSSPNGELNYAVGSADTPSETLPESRSTLNRVNSQQGFLLIDTGRQIFEIDAEGQICLFEPDEDSGLIEEVLVPTQDEYLLFVETAKQIKDKLVDKEAEALLATAQNLLQNADEKQILMANSLIFMLNELEQKGLVEVNTAEPDEGDLSTRKYYSLVWTNNKANPPGTPPPEEIVVETITMPGITEPEINLIRRVEGNNNTHPHFVIDKPPINEKEQTLLLALLDTAYLMSEEWLMRDPYSTIEDGVIDRINFDQPKGAILIANLIARVLVRQTRRIDP
jgi:hypothetical protein